MKEDIMGSKHSKTTASLSNTNDTHWQVAFISQYEIQPSKKLNKHARKSLYTQLKIDLKRIFNELHDTNPDFKTIRIHFNEDNQSIKIGYDYSDFQGYINSYSRQKNSKSSWLLPNVRTNNSNDIQTIYKNNSFEVSSDFTLLAADGTFIAVTRGHKNFNSEVEKCLKEKAERHFEYHPPVDSTKKTIISNIVELFKQQKETIRLAIGESHNEPDGMQMLMEAVK